MAGIINRSLFTTLIISLIFSCIACNGEKTARGRNVNSTGISDTAVVQENPDHYQPVNAMIVSPKNPVPGETFRILATGGKNIRKAQIFVTGPSGELKSLKSKTGEEMPYWRIDDFAGGPAGSYKATLMTNNKVVSSLEFIISQDKENPQTGVVWRSLRGWDSGMETLYSTWINALFKDYSENASWSALHEVTQNKDQNFLHNYLSLGEDDHDGKIRVIMQPDCADNPFFLRAYFAWKLGLPFGYHVCDRGYVGHNPKTGLWVTNETSGTKTNPVLAFNAFLRKVMDGVHSGTARTALDDVKSDYYPVPLERAALLPGTVYADPYGHTMIIIGWIEQKNGHPGLLLSVDAQPDGTVGIKRFWKGNFLFNTSEVVGEPGFKAFRPISLKDRVPFLVRYNELTTSSGFIPYSLQQRKMGSDVFYKTMERLINPRPLNPEDALTGLIQSLHEQLLVRVTSVANSEAYFKLHPGTVIPMPSDIAGVFQAGGQWEAFSTPNRDLRLLIAMDAVLGFPDQVEQSREDFDISTKIPPGEIRKNLQLVLDHKASELSVSYTRTDGSEQLLTLSEILKRRDAFEMAYNPNDGIEIRWGAPEKSDERSTCRRHSPVNQLEKMRLLRIWFQKRLHPPT
ncbi:MAG TPA: hypothetical protein VMV74_06005 [Bacteroidales bacterium]|nr:hypothetical protein [Bacteroidales bacterium]